MVRYQPTGGLGSTGEQQQAPPAQPQTHTPPRPDIPPGPPPPAPPPGPPVGPGQQPARPPVGIYDVYRQGYNRMQQDAQRGIEGAMAGAGFGGNRYGTAAMGQAAEAFNRANQPFQEQFTGMMYQQGQADLNRQLQAAQFGMGHSLDQQRLALQNMLGQGQLGMDFASTYDQMMKGRADALLGAGAGQTGRFDTLVNQAMGDYQSGKFGYLPLVNSFLGNAMPAPQSPTTTTSGGGPTTMDYVSTAAGIAAMFMMASDRRMKKNVKATGKKIGPFREYTWKYKGTNKVGRGPMAQDVEKLYPSAVVTLPGSDYKMINTAVLVNQLAGV